jgi:enoyl-CoA hydratase/carnithine racemase
LAIHNCSKPTIVAINGAAVGIGITMCLPATIRIACNHGSVLGLVLASSDRPVQSHASRGDRVALLGE